MKFNRAVAAVTALTLGIAPMSAPVAAAAVQAMTLPPLAGPGPAGFSCATPAGPIASQPITGALSRANVYRSLAGLGGLTENATWSNGDRLHARYEVKNDTIGHDEDPNNAWCTVAGYNAAQTGNVAVSYSTSTTDMNSIDQWMQGPFHAVGILDPALRKTGFGSYREVISGHLIQEAAVLDVIRGLGTIPASVHYPVKFPSGTKALPIRSAPSGEYPNPLSSCPGYTAPSGPPIILQVGSGNSTIGLNNPHSLKLNGVAQPSCVYNERTYMNTGDAFGQQLGRDVLASRDAIVLIPKNPLKAGRTYSVSITNNGHVYQWTFKVAANAH